MEESIEDEDDESTGGGRPIAVIGPGTHTAEPAEGEIWLHTANALDSVSAQLERVATEFWQLMRIGDDSDGPPQNFPPSAGQMMAFVVVSLEIC